MLIWRCKSYFFFFSIFLSFFIIIIIIIFIVVVVDVVLLLFYKYLVHKFSQVLIQNEYNSLYFFLKNLKLCVERLPQSGNNSCKEYLAALQYQHIAHSTGFTKLLQAQVINQKQSAFKIIASKLKTYNPIYFEKYCLFHILIQKMFKRNIHIEKTGKIRVITK